MPHREASSRAFTLGSPDFDDGGELPQWTTCLGLALDRPPGLRWSGAPARTVEFALIVEDPDAVGGTIDHWVVYGIPPDDQGSDAGHAPEGAQEGLNSFLLRGWLPPCAPSWTPHHYEFTLYALDAPLAVPGPQPPSAADVMDAMEGHVVGAASLTGLASILG